MYLGPPIPMLGLGTGQIFRNGIHPHLIEATKQCVALGELFVPITLIGTVRRQLALDAGRVMRGVSGPYVTFYREVQKWLTSQAKQPN